MTNMSTRQNSILFVILLLLSFPILLPALCKSKSYVQDHEDDLPSLDEPHNDDQNNAIPLYFDHEDEPIPYLDSPLEFDIDSFDDSESEYKEPEIDDANVVVLKKRNFSDFVSTHKFVVVKFYEPSSWHWSCQDLAPEYAAAAAELKRGDEVVVFAKVDAVKEGELARQHGVHGIPTFQFFVDGVYKTYTGAITKDAIVNWIKKKVGPGIYNIITLDEAESVLTSENKVILAYLDSLVSEESEELAAASRLEDDVNFYQTVNPEVAKLFHIDPEVGRPALVMVKKEAEKISYFDDQFDQSAIADFVFANKVPLVTAFTRENAPLIFESLIERQLLLFATSNDSEKVLPIFEEAAKFFKRKLNFGYVEMEYKDVAKRASDYFGVTGHVPKVLAYRKGNDNANKYILDGELTPDEIKAFGEDFLEDKLKPFFKSKPIPETNDGAVKIVVGINFDDIVLDESKDVLLKIYEPWSNNCQALEPNYNQLAKYLSSIKSLVIAKIDGTTNEHPKAKVYGFPTFLFFPAGNKSSDPIKIVYTDRTVMALYKFLKKHISMPLEWCRPASAIKCEASDVEESRKSITINLKDEF